MAIPPPNAGRFMLGVKSLAVLSTVTPQLQKVVRRAITITDVDFMVKEGMRSASLQMQYWLNGTSQLNGIPVGQKNASGTRGTGLSNHQSGNAVDLVAYVEGKPTWEPWLLYYSIAYAMKKAAEMEGVELIWGGAWDTPMSKLGTEMKREVEKYSARRRKSAPGKKILLDGPHFEFVGSLDP